MELFCCFYLFTTNLKESFSLLLGVDLKINRYKSMKPKSVKNCVSIFLSIIDYSAILFWFCASTLICFKTTAFRFRFYAALILHDLVQELPLGVVCEKFRENRGMIQSLQQSAATFAGIM